MTFIPPNWHNPFLLQMRAIFSDSMTLFHIVSHTSDKNMGNPIVPMMGLIAVIWVKLVYNLTLHLSRFVSNVTLYLSIQGVPYMGASRVWTAIKLSAESIDLCGSSNAIWCQAITRTNFFVCEPIVDLLSITSSVTNFSAFSMTMLLPRI